MIYIDYKRELVATEETIFTQIENMEDFLDYCREYWLDEYDSYSNDLLNCFQEVMEDHKYEDLEDIILTEDLPEWGYVEIKSVLAVDWIADNYRTYHEPNMYGELIEEPHYLEGRPLCEI